MAGSAIPPSGDDVDTRIAQMGEVGCKAFAVAGIQHNLAQLGSRYTKEVALSDDWPENVEPFVEGAYDELVNKPELG